MCLEDPLLHRPGRQFRHSQALEKVKIFSLSSHTFEYVAKLRVWLMNGLALMAALRRFSR